VLAWQLGKSLDEGREAEAFCDGGETVVPRSPTGSWYWNASASWSSSLANLFGRFWSGWIFVSSACGSRLSFGRVQSRISKTEK
jgi:hypothetical protein